MKCRSVQQLLRGGRDERWEPRLEAELQAHLAACAKCTGYARDLELLHAWVTGLPLAEPSAAFDWRLRLRLAKADAGDLPPLFAVREEPRHAWWQFAVSAAAAAALVVVVGTHYRADEAGVVASPSAGRSVSAAPSGGGRIIPVSDGRFYGPQPALSYSYFIIQDVRPDTAKDSAQAVPAAPR